MEAKNENFAALIFCKRKWSKYVLYNESNVKTLLILRLQPFRKDDFLVCIRLPVVPGLDRKMWSRIRTPAIRNKMSSPGGTKNKKYSGNFCLRYWYISLMVCLWFFMTFDVGSLRLIIALSQGSQSFSTGCSIWPIYGMSRPDDFKLLKKDNHDEHTVRNSCGLRDSEFENIIVEKVLGKFPLK